MTQLTEIQSELLKAAAQADGGTTPISADARNSAKGLIKRGLALAVPRSDGPSWLLITSTGREAIGDGLPASHAGESAGCSNKDAVPDTTAASSAVLSPQMPEPAKAPSGKVALLIELLRRPDGATINDLMAATGWQAHSVRGALSAAVKKKTGTAVISVTRHGHRVYSLPMEAGGL